METTTENVANIEETQPNYWLNALVFEEAREKEQFLEIRNHNDVMTRPVWTLSSSLTMFSECQRDDLEVPT